MIHLLYSALRSPYGTVIQTPSPDRLRQKLYALRKNDPDLEVLSFVISPTAQDELWIVKRNPDA